MEGAAVHRLDSPIHIAPGELDALVATPLGQLTLPGGKVIQVQPLRVRQLGPFMRAVQAFAGLLRFDGQPVDLLPVVLLHAEQVQLAVCVALDLEVAEVAEWEVDTLANAIGVILAVNVDFFVKRLAPSMQGIARQLQEILSRLPTPPAQKDPAGSTSQPG